MSFTDLNLNKNIQNALDKCGYKTPTPIQAKSIPAILKGKDVVACAQTGTGKTAAFVLPALERLSTQKPSRETKILILTPTRELATQITKAAMQYGKFLKFNIVNLVGGMPYERQIRELNQGADIIVATPGRLLDHIDSKRVDLSTIQMLVLDEADRMLDMGFIDDVKDIAGMTPLRKQTLLFSATSDKQLDNIIRELLHKPTFIDLSQKEIASPNIQQFVYRATNQQHKIAMLRYFLNDEHIYKAIIFSATKVNADKLATLLRNEGYPAAALHGDLRQNVRNRTIDQLRRGKIQFLIATDVAARGIDINDITHVINYDMPRFCEDYVHRIGRTGRAGKNGIAVSFVTSIEFKHLKRIERYIGKHLKIAKNMDGLKAPKEPVEPFQLQEEKRQHSRGKRPFKKRAANKSRFSDDDKRSGDKPAFGNKKRSRFSDDDRRSSDKPSFNGKKRSRFSDDDKRSSDKPSFSGKKRSRFSDDDKRSSDKPSFSGKKRNRFSDDDKRSSDKPSFSGKKRSRFSDDDRRSSDKPSFSGKKRSRFSSDDKRSSDKPSFGGKKRNAKASEARSGFAHRKSRRAVGK